MLPSRAVAGTFPCPPHRQLAATVHAVPRPARRGWRTHGGSPCHEDSELAFLVALCASLWLRQVSSSTAGKQPGGKERPRELAVTWAHLLRSLAMGLTSTFQSVLGLL